MDYPTCLTAAVESISLLYAPILLDHRILGSCLTRITPPPPVPSIFVLIGQLNSGQPLTFCAISISAVPTQQPIQAIGLLSRHTADHEAVHRERDTAHCPSKGANGPTDMHQSKR